MAGWLSCFGGSQVEARCQPEWQLVADHRDPEDRELAGRLGFFAVRFGVIVFGSSPLVLAASVARMLTA